MTQPEDPTRPFEDPVANESSDPAMTADNAAASQPPTADVPEPPARMPGAYPPYVPPVADPTQPFAETGAPVADAVAQAEPDVTQIVTPNLPPMPPPDSMPRTAYQQDAPSQPATTMVPVPQAPALPASEQLTTITPASMSGPASTDTETWELPPASALAGAAAASQWAQPAPAVPQPIPPQPIAPASAVPAAVTPPPPQTWQPAPAQPAPAPAPVPAQQWQQPPPAAQQWQQPPPPQQQWQQPAQAAQPGQPVQPGQQWPQQQYQQPYAQPYGQQAPYAQPYGQQWAQQPGYGTSPLAAFAGLLLIVFGIGVVAIGLLALTQGQELARFIRDNDIAIFGSSISRDTLRAALSPSPGVLIFLGLLQLIAGAGVMAHKSWGRWFGFLLALFGLVVTIFAVSIGLAVAGGFTLPVIIGVVMLVGYVLIVLALLAGGSHFRRRPVAR